MKREISTKTEQSIKIWRTDYLMLKKFAAKDMRSMKAIISLALKVYFQMRKS